MDLLTRMVEHHIWLAGEMIGRARRLPAAELDKPFEVPVDEDRQTLRSLLSAGRPDGDVELRDRQQLYGWPAEEHRGLGRDAGKAGPDRASLPTRGRRRWCWRFNLGSPPSWIGAT
jgi:hypothetical protein